jgi:hypothetical protein
VLKKTIKYTDFNGVEREEDFYFNLTKTEVAEMEFSITGGMKHKIDKIVSLEDNVEIMRIFKDIIMSSYGVKSDDGKRFEKSEELSIGFTQMNAYDELFMEIASDAKAAAAFVNGILPDLTEEEKK